jgi:hypothetical protein
VNYEQLYNTIQAYAQNTESTFIAYIPTFIQECEERVYNSVQFPSLRKNVTGNLTANNPYLSLPNDYLSTYSLALYQQSGSTYTLPYTYLLNKDVNFIRQLYPDPSVTSTPKYYALFGTQYSNPNELSLILGPTPDVAYTAELHYFYYPPSIVQGIITAITLTAAGSNYIPGFYPNVPFQYFSTSGNQSGVSGYGDVLVSSSGTITSVSLQNGGSFYLVNDVLTVNTSYLGGSSTASGFSFTVNSINNSNGQSWLGDNFDPVLLYGSMREAMIFMKGEQDMMTYYEQKYQEALQLAIRLGNGLERGDAYRDGQTKLNTNLNGNVIV